MNCLALLIIATSVTPFVAAIQDATAASKPVTVGYDDIDVDAGKFGLGVEYGIIDDPYFSLNYDKHCKVINIAGDVLTSLQPASPPKVMACPNEKVGAEPYQQKCQFAVYDTSATNYGVTPESFAFACATDLLVKKEPEVADCKVQLACKSAKGTEHTVNGTFAGSTTGTGVRMKQVTTGFSTDEYFYTCTFKLLSAQKGAPIESGFTILVDKFKYLYRKLPTTSSSMTPSATKSA